MIKQCNEDTVICISFARETASQTLQSLLENTHRSYTKESFTDLESNEHMYNVTRIDDLLSGPDMLSEDIAKELRYIKKAMDGQNASYFRLIT